MQSINIKINANTTNVTNIDNSLKSINVGIDSLVKANAQLPSIAAGLLFIQNNVAWLSDVRGNLQGIRSDVTQINSGVEATGRGVAGIGGAVARANTQLEAISRLLAGSPEIKPSLDAIQLTLSRIEAKISGGDVIETTTTSPSKSKVIECLEKGGRIYFMGPSPGGSFDPCMTNDEWGNYLTVHKEQADKSIVGSYEKRAELCRTVGKEWTKTAEFETTHGKEFSSKLLEDWLMEAKSANLPQGLRLAGVMAYDAISVVNLETNVQLTIEYATFCKDIQFEKSKISRTLSLDGSLFLGNLAFTNSTLGEDLRIRNAVTRTVSFLSTTTINGTTDLSDTTAARAWHFVGATIGQLEAIHADLRDLNITDTEIKRALSIDGARVRRTLLVQGSTVGSDFNLANARLTHTTVRRATIKSDFRLKDVDARCSTKVHKSKIDGDVIIDGFRFGAVEPEGRPGVSADKPIDGQFNWSSDAPSPTASRLAGQDLVGLFPKLDDEVADDADQQSGPSQCEIRTYPKQDRPQPGAAPPPEPKPTLVYQSSGVLDLVDSAIGGSICAEKLEWQRGLQGQLKSRAVYDLNKSSIGYEPQNVFSLNGTTISKYTILGSIKHPAGQSTRTDRSQFARFDLVGFKTGRLVLSNFATGEEFKKLISQLEVDAVLSADAGCPLDDLGFSRSQTQPADGPRAAEASTLPTIHLLPGATAPLDQDVMKWLDDNEITTTQPYTAMIAALAKSGVDPINLRVEKAWRDLKTDWRQMGRDTVALFGPQDENFGFLSAFKGVSNGITDFVQLLVRTVHGGVSAFSFRPARSLIIAGILILLIAGILRAMHGRVAYLYVPAAKVTPGAADVALDLFKEFGNEWRVITLPVVVRMMIPQAITSVPLLGGLFTSVTFDWSKYRIIGFRRADMVHKSELASDQPGNIQPLPPWWSALTPVEAATIVMLPYPPRPFSYTRILVNSGVDRLSGKAPPPSPTASIASPVDVYLPGLLVMPQSGSLLQSLGWWSWVGYAAAAALASGIIALLKF